MPPSVNIKQETKKSTNEKFSGFFVTINSNKRSESTKDDTAMANTFRRAVSSFYRQSDILKVIYDRRTDDVVDPELLDTIDINYTFELGKRNGAKNKLHSHGIIKIRHRTKIKLNYEAIRSWFKKIFLAAGYSDESSSIHLDVKPFGDTNRNLLYYITKDL